MNIITHSTTAEEVTVIIETDDGNGNILEEEVTETRTTLHSTVTHKSADDMASQYNFNDDQKEHMDALLEEGTASMWAAVLYGVYGEDDQIVAVVLSQIGNVGGMPYWSWYGFGVGIVQKVEDGHVYTVEGNSGDSCRQKSYPLGYYEILGYAIPAY